MPRQWRAICANAARISAPSSAAASWIRAAGTAARRQCASAVAATGLATRSMTEGSGKVSPGPRISTMVGPASSSVVLRPTEPWITKYSSSGALPWVTMTLPRGTVIGSTLSSTLRAGRAPRRRTACHGSSGRCGSA